MLGKQIKLAPRPAAVKKEVCEQKSRKTRKCRAPLISLTAFVEPV